MQFFNFKFLITLLLTFQKHSQKNNECILSATVYPLTFISRRSTVELRLDLTSNCSDFPIKFLYILSYSKVYDISLRKHPKRVILDVLGRAFQMDFSSVKKKNEGGHDNLIYSKVRLSPSEVPVRFETVHKNHILLRTSSTNRFTKKEIEKLEELENPIICKMMKGNRTLVCKM